MQKARIIWAWVPGWAEGFPQLVSEQEEMSFSFCLSTA